MNKQKINKILWEVLAFFIVIPMAIGMLAWYILRFFWVFAGLTLVFAFIFSEMDPLLTPEQCVGYGSSASVLCGIISKVYSEVRK